MEHLEEAFSSEENNVCLEYLDTLCLDIVKEHIFVKGITISRSAPHSHSVFLSSLTPLIM